MAIADEIPNTTPIIPRMRPKIAYFSKKPRFFLEIREVVIEPTAKTRLMYQRGQSAIESTPHTKEITDQRRLRDLIASGSA